MTVWRDAFRKQVAVGSAPMTAIVNFGKLPDKWDGDEAVRIRATADPRDLTYKGQQELRRSRVQIDCFSRKSSNRATALAELINDAIKEPWVDNALSVRFDLCQVEGPEDGGSQEPTLYAHRARLDVIVWHART